MNKGIFVNLKIAIVSIPRSFRKEIVSQGGTVPVVSQAAIIVTSVALFEIYRELYPKSEVVPQSWLESCLSSNSFIEPSSFSFVPPPPNSFFAQYIFYIDLTSKVKTDKAKKLIISGGGTYLLSLLPSIVTHVVSNKKRKYQVLKVSFKWLKSLCTSIDKKI